MEDAANNPERILAEARALLQEEGLDGMSLRKLATRLGVSAPSLYWHFADKDALLAALLQSLFYEVLDTLPAERDWKKWMRAYGRAIWQAETRARDFSRLVTTARMSPRQMEDVSGRIGERLRKLNLAEVDGMRLQSSIMALVTGWSAFANAPYGQQLDQMLDFDEMLARDIDALIDAEARRQRAKN